jgi:3-methyladenine DNA glycosylase/8-oxoguanine DNA glycosylase
MDRSAAYARLQAVPGIGPWTAAETAKVALGDTDAVSVGDYHLGRFVVWALTGAMDGDDEQMLELLEPYRPMRQLVIRLLELTVSMPRRGPRASRVDHRRH